MYCKGLMSVHITTDEINKSVKMNKITEKMKNPADCDLLSVLVFYHIMLLVDKNTLNV